MTEEAESNPRAASIRIGSMTAKTHSGQRRHDMRIGSQPEYVDANRKGLNRTLIEPPSAAVMRGLASARRAKRETQRGMRSDAGIATAGVITFGAEAAEMFEVLTPDQQDRAFRLLARATAMRLRTSLHGLVVHRDEATIHAHFVLCGYDRDGMPLSKSTKPSSLSALQDLTAKVMQRSCSGIERGTRYGDRLSAGADYADTVHRSVKELHRDLPRDLERRRQQVIKLAEAEAEAVARVSEMRDRVEKLNAKVDLSEKEAKRLSTYEKRLADRVVELEQAAAASEEAKVEADRLADLAKQDKAASDAEAAQVKAKAEADAGQLRAEAAAEARAHAAAFVALASEIEAGSIRYDENGKMMAANPSALSPGRPHIEPAVRAALKASKITAKIYAEAKADREAARKQHQEAIFARADAMEAKEEALGLVQTLRGMVGRLRLWLQRADLPSDLATEAKALDREVQATLSPKESPEESQSGPGI